MTEPSSTTAAATPDTATPSAAAPHRQVPARRRARFSARDLLNVAIFAVIYIVIVFAVAMLGVISPLIMLLTLPLSAIAAGIPYVLFLTRVKHAGMVTLFGTVVALFFLVSGQPWQSTIVTIVLSVLADLILATGKFVSKWATIWAYTVFSAWFIGPYIPMFLDRDAYLTSVALEGMGEEYRVAFDQVVSTPSVLIMWVATIICGFIGGLLGTAILRKHFRKAGLA